MQILIDDLLQGKELNRGERKIHLRHMQRTIFSFCQAKSSKSTFVNIETPLFGPIVGEPFIEEEDDNPSQMIEHEEQEIDPVLPEQVNEQATLTIEAPVQGPDTTDSQPQITSTVGIEDNVFKEICAEDLERLEKERNENPELVYETAESEESPVEQEASKRRKLNDVIDEGLTVQSVQRQLT